MSFAHAAASKGILAWTGISSVIVSTFGRKYLCHLQLVPHITRDHQFWRLISQNLAFTSSIDLFVAILVLYNTSITLERRYGTAKFVSFALVTTFFGTAFEVLSLSLFRYLNIAIVSLPAGPFTFIFALLYNYSKSVPSSYTYKVFGLSFNSKSLLYLLAAQLAFAMPPNSLVTAACGILAGVLYRSNILGSRSWRIPQWLQRLGKTYLSPLLDSGRMPRRSARTTLDDADPAPGTSRLPSGTATQNGGGRAQPRQGAMAEVMQTFASTRTAAGPPAEAVAQLQAMFPSASVDQINSALQRGGNDVNRSVEYLL
ncbi:hypothetical protein P389DRAFT_55154 [Cystobasidium minutum MCA 4210]|uniref:uncharacterized protein n=1 Tax=Cystobasidium minutum MCA 4210 TaxID=1397322 RepID=UPI0034CE6EE1|eukprot:jgi/Rhomi1/55154/CE55153_692